MAALSSSVSSLQASLQLLDASIGTLDAGVGDFPRLCKVLQTTRVSDAAQRLAKLPTARMPCNGSRADDVDSTLNFFRNPRCATLSKRCSTKSPLASRICWR